MEGLILVVVLAILVITTIAMGVRIVPQGMQYIVQRLGKYHKTLKPGLNVVIPYIDTIPHKITTKDQVLEVPSQEVITRDNAVIVANAVGYINVHKPEDAAYGVEDYHVAIRTIIQTSLRSIIGQMDLDEALSSRERIKAELKNSISDDIAGWGVALKTVEIQDINPSPTMQKAMEAQAAAERQRRATITLAQGEKDATVLEAEGRLEAAKKDAEAKKVQAEASKEAIKVVLEAAGEGNAALSVGYLLGESYVKSMEKMAASQNGKMIVLPADLQSAIKGMFTMNAAK